MANKSKTKVVTGKVRFSYAHVFEPKENLSGKEKYSVCLLIPKSDTKTVAKVKAAIKAAFEEGKAKFGGKLPKTWKNPLRDGDAEREDSPEYEGMYFINANANNKPYVVDSSLEPIMERGEFYSGCYGNGSVNFYAYNTNGSKGVACGLNGVRKTEDGERLSGGGASPESDFADFEDDDLME